MKDKIIDLGDFDIDDLEDLIFEYMVGLAYKNGIDWVADGNEFGENIFILSGVKYKVQWTYVGLESVEFQENDEGDYVPVGGWYWEYDAPDFEISSLVKVNEMHIPTENIVEVKESELNRLKRIESLFWQIESSLPSGLESWIDDEELQELRND
ncbi:hypothetical protein AVV36_gp082 [Pectobacterium bacteriophage PM2]|uniref:Uncharacterized protein n=1 Tax=Pectobacterium bacteriophage PM2 TaxID=1429794 RepID=A0A0A0PZG1_9CAUD|nr:hypothetical protein AVV36_gp082 [Pectobacterium bacteriophage PM2]AHY25044.1 hypothetical protein PM2_082 [Pectobacterium bacteriophage PM2]